VKQQQATAKSTGERRRDRRLEDIAEAARGLFAARGFNETSLADIADAVDLSPKAIYYYYPSKRAILDVILESGFVYFEAAELAAARTRWKALTLREALIESAVGAAEHIVSHAELLRLSFSETFRGNAMTQARHEKYMRNLTEHFELIISEPPRANSLRPERRRPLALALAAAIFGMSVDCVLRGREQAWSQHGPDSELRIELTDVIEALLDAND